MPGLALPKVEAEPILTVRSFRPCAVYNGVYPNFCFETGDE